MTSTYLCRHCGVPCLVDHRGESAHCQRCGAVIKIGRQGQFLSVKIFGTVADEVSRVARELVAHISAVGAENLFEAHQPGIPMDPIAVIGAVSSGLGLVDKFVTLVGKLRSQDSKPFKVETKQEGNNLVIRESGNVVETITPPQIQLNEFDGPRFEALKRRVTSLWNQFNGLYGQLPTMSVDEQVRIREKMEQMRRELCQDFREMIDISEKVLGVPLHDHYTLHRTCDS